MVLDTKESGNSDIERLLDKIKRMSDNNNNDQNAPTIVFENDFKSGTDFLYSEQFGSCIAVFFLDDKSTKGAIAHLNANADPDQCFHGYIASWPGQPPIPVESLSDIYPEPSKVKVLQIDHVHNSVWNAHLTQSVLSKLGFTDFYHYELEDTDHKVWKKNMALDVKGRQLHIESPTGIITIPIGTTLERQESIEVKGLSDQGKMLIKLVQAQRREMDNLI